MLVKCLILPGFRGILIVAGQPVLNRVERHTNRIWHDGCVHQDTNHSKGATLAQNNCQHSTGGCSNG